MKHALTPTTTVPVGRSQVCGGTARLALAAAALLAAFAHVIPARAAEDHVSIEFRNCTEPEQTVINQAFADAGNVLALAVADLNASTPDPDVAKVAQRLFGRSTPLTTVAEGLAAIAARLDPKASPIEVTCHPTDTSVYAWVPSEYCGVAGFAELHLARLFFEAPARAGLDTRMGTIIHEVAHLAPGLAANCVHNGNDRHGVERYGTGDVLLMGRLDPGYALRNAQSYEYFVEDLYGY